MEWQPDEAIAELQRTAGVEPDFVLTHRRLGLAFEAKGMYERAIAEFQKAVSATPEEVTRGSVESVPARLIRLQSKISFVSPDSEFLMNNATGSESQDKLSTGRRR